MKTYIALIAIAAICMSFVKKMHDNGTTILASMAEEYSVCTNVNACSDEDLNEMIDLLLEQGEYRSRMWIRFMLAWEQWEVRL